MSDDHDSDDIPAVGASRRQALRLGTVGAAAIVSIRPALAQTSGSVLNCEVPIPDAGRRGGYIDVNGNVVPAGTANAYPPMARPYKGEEVRLAMQTGARLPGTTSGDHNRAYINYIRRLQRGTSGFTCFASLQMPRR